MSHGNRSAVIIARILGVEGYSDFVHNQIERYWRRKVMVKTEAKRIAKLESDFSGIMADMDDDDKKVIGAFISLRSRMNFDSGLRIGLVAHAHERDKPVFIEGQR